MPKIAGLFPRSIDRGLIEASRSAKWPQWSDQFPRSIDRGLIEAVMTAFYVTNKTNFCDQWIAASLKLPLTKRRRLLRKAYFRDQLIAASLKLRVNGGRSYYRHDFRDQLIAASLKLGNSWILSSFGHSISAIN